MKYTFLQTYAHTHTHINTGWHKHIGTQSFGTDRVIYCDTYILHILYTNHPAITFYYIVYIVISNKYTHTRTYIYIFIYILYIIHIYTNIHTLTYTLNGNTYVANTHIHTNKETSRYIISQKKKNKQI